MTRPNDRRRRLEIKAWYRGLMAEQKCSKCGEDHPGVLDWHHIDPSTKKNNIPTLIGQAASIATITSEMAKCIVVCANCHRKIHWEELQNNETDNRT